MEKYKVAEIYEMDFGCEGRAEDMKDMVLVRLCSDTSENITVRASDASLYEQGITHHSNYIRGVEEARFAEGIRTYV